VTALAEIDPLAAAAGATIPTERQLGLPDELLGEFSIDAAPLRAEQYIKRQQAILQRLFGPAKGSALHTPRTQRSILLRLFELCKNVDTEGTGMLPAHQFRCILQCVCYWLQSTEISELMPHANSETTIRYDELLVAGRVTLIQKTEAPLLKKKISYKAWLVRSTVAVRKLDQLCVCADSFLLFALPRTSSETRTALTATPGKHTFCGFVRQGQRLASG
jgi:hypothetical protein